MVSRASMGAMAPMQTCVSLSMNVSILRARSHSSSGGTTEHTVSLTGLEMMPAARIIRLNAEFYSTRDGGRGEKTPGCLWPLSRGWGALQESQVQFRSEEHTS